MLFAVYIERILSGLPIFVGVAYHAVVRGVAYAVARGVAYAVAHTVAYAVSHAIAYVAAHVIVYAVASLLRMLLLRCCLCYIFSLYRTDRIRIFNRVIT